MSEKKTWPRRRILLLSAGGVGFLLLLGGGVFAGLAYFRKPEPVQEAAAPAPPPPPPPIELPEKKGPPAQQAVLAAIEAVRAALPAGAGPDTAPMVDALRAQRAQAVCQALRDGPPRRWVGTISQVGVNEDKRGTLTIDIAPGVSVKTWNTAPADAGYGTLLDPKSPFFVAAEMFGRGQQVVFSGTLFPSPLDCVSLSSLSPVTVLREPAFILKFDELGPLGPVKSLQAAAEAKGEGKAEGKADAKAAKGDHTGSTGKH
ncbi:MAG: hypothetical protein AB1698_01955 [Pseudomonadota bacterium]